MDLSDIKNKDQFFIVVINELKTFGVKYQKEKKKKHIQDKHFRKNIFRTQIHLLDLTDVILSNGRVVQIPKFVADACNRILEQVETEGIFRKAGSFVRQKEIRISIESGVALGKSHHVIDVANVIKYFFRELPEPLIPLYIQETLLRSFLVGDNSVKSILLSCLLLPLLTINTLSFFMQFLYTVSLSENYNKMSVENLAIIFTPGLMPYPDINSHRFKNHVKIVRILIENANLIGIIPKYIEYKLRENLNTAVLKTSSSDQFINKSNIPNENGSQSASVKKKKKRRSEMFIGLKKIVTGSSEYLDSSPNKNKNESIHKSVESVRMHIDVRNTVATPCSKENKKRKLNHTYSNKKKIDTLSLLPSVGILSNSPILKESKKSRLSLGGGRHIKNSSVNPIVTSMERRWSIVGSGWSKAKNKNAPEKEFYISDNCMFNVESTKEITKSVENYVINTNNDIEEIKESVTTVEYNFSNELDALSNSISQNSPIPEQSEKILLKTDAKASPVTKNLTRHFCRDLNIRPFLDTDNLTQCFSRDLNIRQSVDKRIIRSPSARKIGTIRQRSHDKKRISRNSSWHIIITNSDQPLPLEIKHSPNQIHSNIFLDKNNKTCLINKHNQLQTSAIKNPIDILNNKSSNEQWMSGEKFFSDLSHAEHVTTPVNSKNHFDVKKTPMLPPKSLPKKFSNVRTPLNTVTKSATTSKLPFVNRIAIATPVIEEASGRASIARLRAQNAGMVLAKTKLFDGLGNRSNNEHQVLETNQQSTDIKRKSVHSNSNITLSFKENNVSLENKPNTSSRCTPVTKRIHETNLNSAATSSKRSQRCNANKHSRRQILISNVS